MMRRALVFAAALALAAPALAHDLRVFASVSGDTVSVESSYPNGRVPSEGELRVSDAEDRLILTLPLSEDGVTRFPLPEGAGAGLSIVVETANGHSDYWLLTPEDIARGQEGS